MTTTTLKFRILSKALGAEVLGVDTSEPPDDETYEALRSAWLEHQILLFREQHITLPQQIAFSRRFGELYVSPKRKRQENEFPEVGTFSNIKKNGEYIGQPPARTGDGWHSDLFYMEKPATGSLFRAEQAPLKGGETWFANMYAAYDALPDSSKQRIDGLRATYSEVKSWNVIDPELKPLTEEEKRHFPDVTHPLVRTHPETGCKSLFAGMRGSQCSIVEGMGDDESVAFLDDLRAFATQARFTYRHQWRPGDVMLWDNRCTMHKATIFDDSLGPRLCYRTTIAGEVPY